ncbi:MAG: hypothetical protein NVSMB31_02770 [Vulcanimicrobiaceae bacterium]
MKFVSHLSIITTLALAACSGGGASSPVPAPLPPAIPSVTQGSLVTLDANGNVNVYAPGSSTSSQTFNVGTFASTFCIDRTGKIVVVHPADGFRTYGLDTYAATANGAATPIASVTNTFGVSNHRGLECAVDSIGNRYVASAEDSSINNYVEVFAPSLSGVSPPSGKVQSTSVISRIAVDASDNLYLGAGFASPGGDHIEVYPRWSGSPPVMTRSITHNFVSLAVDAGGLLYLTDQSTPSVTALMATGAGSTVLRTIAGPLTMIGPATGYVMARADNAGNIYVANQSTNIISVFDPSANGNVAPARTVTLPANTQYLQIAP